MLRRVLLLVSILLLGNVFAKAQSAEDSTQTESLSAYEKLFEDKKVETSEGLVTLRKMDGKVYFEFPDDLLEKDLLLGTAVSLTSNTGDAAVGERPQSPLPIYFTKTDSTIHMRVAEFSNKVENGADNIRQALQKNNIGPIINSFEIAALTPDSNAYVFDATDIFLSDNNRTDPFGPYSGVRTLFGGQKQNFKKGLSTLVDVDAYKDNVTVTSYLSFGITSTFMGFQVEKDRPATYQVKHTLVRLPDEQMRPRHSDPRIGVADSEYLTFSANDNGIQTLKYAHRWDIDAEPIVFYIDDNFPDYLKDDVEQGVKDWNKAFEKIGFSDVISTKPFPKDDSDFSPDNTSYSTINYVLSGRSNALAQSWVDPRSGEVLSAAVNIYKGTLDKARKDLFIRTAAADERARTSEIPKELMERTVRDIVAHQVGHTLGLTNNLGASSAIPVDSLRSPTYTQKYGITPSIMDEARYNFVAQPGDLDRGVQMTPNDLGVYDYYAIRWLYEPITSAATPKDEVTTLERWIAERIDDPMYQYRKQQVRGIFDPQIQANDLGDDQIKATAYALKNLRYVLNNMNDWLEGEDNDYAFRTEMNFNIINIDFFWYIRQVYNNIGGVYQYQKFEGDPYPAYQVVSKDRQQQSVTFLLETLEELVWLDNADLENNMNSINGDASKYMQTVLFRYLLDWGLRTLDFSQQKSYQQPYTIDIFLDDVYDYVWEMPGEKDQPSNQKVTMQKSLVNYLIQKSPVVVDQSGSNGNQQALNESQWTMLQMGKNRTETLLLQDIRNKRLSSTEMAPSHSYADLFGMDNNLSNGGEIDVKDKLYILLKRSQKELREAIKQVDGDTKQEYVYMLMRVNKALEIG